jgi:hypothetical protein
VIPPDHDGEFVARMEDVLALYQRPYDPDVPVLCLDERPVQMVEETRKPIPAGPGRPMRVDYEYERKGVANVFMFCEPLAGWRQVIVTSQRTKIEWALALRDVLDHRYRHVAKVCVVMDNLNIHSIGSLYEAFPPAEARRLAAKLEIHSTPKHGSWLNIAENELSALSTQCLTRRIPSIGVLQREVAAWEASRNQDEIQVRWRFSIERARVKLARVYPLTQN